MKRRLWRLLPWAGVAALLLPLLLMRAAQPAPVQLTERERAWLREAPVVIVGAQVAYPPFDFTDRSGRASGYANELFRLAADRVGLRYRFVTGLQWQEILQRARDGRIDVLTCLWISPERQRDLRFVQPAYAQHVIGLATREDDADPPHHADMAGERIALVEGFAINPQLRAAYPQARFVEVATPTEALRRVAFGQADGYVDHVSLIEHLRAEHGFANLHIGDQFELQGTEYYMAVAADMPILHGILRKALASVDEAETEALRERWLRAPVAPDSLPEAIGPYLLPVLGGLLAIAAVIAVLMLWNRRLAREVALRREAQAEAHARSAELTRHLHLEQSLLDAAPTPVLAIDDQGRYTLFNAAAERVFGYPASAFLGKPMASPVDEGDGHAPWLTDPGTHRELAAALSEMTGEPVAADWRAFRLAATLRLPPGEIEMLRSDGSRVPLWLGLGPTFDENNRLHGLVAVAVDLSANKRLERELRESEARAQAASHAKSAFLAAMSHEIRTPMIGVTGMIEVLAHSRLDADQRRALNIVQQSSQTLLQVLGDILDFSKIEADRLQLEPAPLDLARLVRGTLANYSGAASSKGLNLECGIDPQLAPAHEGDALRLRQILGNFLSNAIKFTENGGVRVELDAGPPPADGEGGRQSIRLRVIDTGIGVDPAQQVRLFEPFSQADGDSGRRYGGTGLGLAICRRLAELMDGEVRMDSTPGQGTTLTLQLELPVANPAQVPAEPVAATAPHGFQPRQLPSVDAAAAERSLVLVVDDHPTNRLVIARQLALAGYASETAADGREGLERWRSGRYALLLSDVHMPELDGYQLASAIRAEETGRGLPRTPIVALTAAALKGEAERCLDAGMDDYLAKPVAVATLAACLQRWLPHTAAAAPPEAAALPQLAEPPALDPDVLAQYGPPPLQRELLDDYLASTGQDLAGLEAAREAGDTTAVARQAHKIKGAAALVGALELRDTAATLDTIARRGDWRPLPPLIADLHTAAERLRLAIAERYPAA